MPLVLGIDLGTTKLTALALDTRSGDIVANGTMPNRAETTSPVDKAQGFSEWNVDGIAEQACSCLRTVTEQLGNRQRELAGLGITGQQHGVVLVNETHVPLTPLINWQDRRGEQIHPVTGKTYVRQAQSLAGADAPRRAGCKLATGYMAVTLFWMKERAALPSAATACFVMDYFGALLTNRSPVTDPTCAASSGVLDVTTNDWDAATLAALGLPRSLFPEVRLSGDPLGPLTATMAARTGLPAGLPVFVGIGDNQASFLGSVARREDTVLVNVGTGGQVTVYSGEFLYDPILETRPFPRGGYLLVCAGLSGGHAYAVLERFYRAVGEQLFGIPSGQALYPLINQLAAQVPPGADGLRCEPFFSGTRAQPELRATWSGISADNFLPGPMTRALLESMARTFRSGYLSMGQVAPRPRSQLVGAGNGLRENPVLAQLVAEAFGLPLVFPRHREEAAYGAALLAGVGSGIWADGTAAGKQIRYERAAGVG
jgi:sugar (pentulose or hexulose) kinase